MFDQILVPTDGSKFANRAVKAAIKFAAVMKARIIFYRALESNIGLYGMEGFEVPGEAIESMEQALRKSAQSSLDAAVKLARAKGVAAEALLGRNYVPWEGIVSTAKKKKCDVIFMASHGRRGLAGVVLGSVTHQVLTHSKVPVMVFR